MEQSDKKILSVIIPTYNMEKYLRKCLDSLLVSNKELMEILVINDGSTDKSSEIAHEFETKYPSIFKVIDKENGNYGSCVNVGIEKAKGKYVKILDADDSFNSENLDSVLKTMSSIDVDMILTDFVITDEKNNIKNTIQYKIKPNIVLEISEVIEKLYNLEMHAITYRLENLKKIDYKQTEGISYTDQEWIFSPISTVNKIFYINKVLYKYLVGRLGQTIDLNVFHKKIEDRIKITNSLLSTYKQIIYTNKDQKHSSYLLQKMRIRLKGIYITYLIVNRDSYKAEEFDRFLKSECNDLYLEIENMPLWGKLRYKFIKSYRKNYELPPSYISSIYKFIKKIK